MNKYFIRLFRMSDIPIWYTEGFSPHPYVSFALPLSLGYESYYELADLKITDDAFDNDMLLEALNRRAVNGVHFSGAFEPINKTKLIFRSEYQLTFEAVEERDAFFDFITTERVAAEKKSKKGVASVIELTEYTKAAQRDCFRGLPSVMLLLPSGTEHNINPTLCFDAYKAATGRDPYTRTVRTAVLDESMKPFR